MSTVNPVDGYPYTDPPKSLLQQAEGLLYPACRVRLLQPEEVEGWSPETAQAIQSACLEYIEPSTIQALSSDCVQALRWKQLERWSLAQVAAACPRMSVDQLFRVLSCAKHNLAERRVLVHAATPDQVEGIAHLCEREILAGEPLSKEMSELIHLLANKSKILEDYLLELYSDPAKRGDLLLLLEDELLAQILSAWPSQAIGIFYDEQLNPHRWQRIQALFSEETKKVAEDVVERVIVRNTSVEELRSWPERRVSNLTSTQIRNLDLRRVCEAWEGRRLFLYASQASIAAVRAIYGDSLDPDLQIDASITSALNRHSGFFEVEEGGDRHRLGEFVDWPQAKLDVVGPSLLQGFLEFEDSSVEAQEENTRLIQRLDPGVIRTVLHLDWHGKWSWDGDWVFQQVGKSLTDSQAQELFWGAFQTESGNEQDLVCRLFAPPGCIDFVVWLCLREYRFDRAETLENLLSLPQKALATWSQLDFWKAVVGEGQDWERKDTEKLVSRVPFWSRTQLLHALSMDLLPDSLKTVILEALSDEQIAAATPRVLSACE